MVLPAWPWLAVLAACVVAGGACVFELGEVEPAGHGGRAGGGTGGTGTGGASTGGTATGGTSGSDPGICLLNHCGSDQECAACSDGRTRCLEADMRCVACDPDSPSVDCPTGELCSPYGLCAPEGLTCPMDANEVPIFDCQASTDCLACSLSNQVCDGSPPRCVECAESDTGHCTQNDYCRDGHCSPKCPGSCESDAECTHCGGLGAEAHVCFRHKCSQCDDASFACAGDLQCASGECVHVCGRAGVVPGDCVDDSDCAWCGGEGNYESWICKKPVNSGPQDHGICSPYAAGCSDLGNGVAVLPPPWSDYTNLCSGAPDCSGMGIQYNVGALIRDQIGGSELDIGVASLPICDVNVPYDMSECVAIHIMDGIDCAICTPCVEDADCQPIPMAPLLRELFCDDPLAPVAGAFLVDLLWGAAPVNDLNFFCRPTGPDYGVCAPCLNPSVPCATGGGSSGSCDHGECEAGDALGTNCNTCTAAVCATDGYCCDSAWDSLCVGAAEANADCSC